ncbi:SDR family oxidoreductase [Flavobacterium sp.]|uniref:SDR family oxidoreductase n=1 Tax=Flavobacterium sp. TaxID=239 RepID=UPI002FDA2D10
MRQISILGCGWLGLPLAKSLLEKGFSVKGSTTSSEKISILENAGIEAFLLELSATDIKGAIHSFLENSEILIIDIPPKLRGISAENFVAKIQMLIPFVEKSTVEKVIFISSTAVYSDDNSTITEATKPQPDTESGKQLLEVETLLQNHKNFQTTIVRFGGLIGENRHPIKFLAGRRQLENPEGPINLIHQMDCIGILESIIAQECWDEVFNAVTPFHPTRKEYYTQKAIELKLPLPEFEESKTSFGKTIESTKIETVLAYSFKNKTL